MHCAPGRCHCCCRLCCCCCHCCCRLCCCRHRCCQSIPVLHRTCVLPRCSTLIFFLSGALIASEVYKVGRQHLSLRFTFCCVDFHPIACLPASVQSSRLDGKARGWARLATLSLHMPPTALCSSSPSSSVLHAGWQGLGLGSGALGAAAGHPRRRHRPAVPAVQQAGLRWVDVFVCPWGGLAGIVLL